VVLIGAGHYLEKRGKRVAESEAFTKAAKKRIARSDAFAEVVEKRIKQSEGLAKAAEKRTLRQTGLRAVARQAQKPLMVLTAISAAWLLATGKAHATTAIDPEGEDPIMAAMRHLAGTDNAVPEPLSTMIENDEELRRLVAHAAEGGDLSAAQRVAAERAAQLLAQNSDQFSHEEIEALLTAAQAAAQEAPLLEPTVDQLKKVAAGHGAAAGEQESGEPGVMAGAPAQLVGASENVQRLWDALTGTEGVFIDASFAKKFQAQIGDDLSEEELAALFDVLTMSESEITDPDELLALLKALLDAKRRAAAEVPGERAAGPEPGKSTDAKSGEKTVEESHGERILPAPTGELGTEDMLELLRSELTERPASDWPSVPGVLRLRRRLVSADAASKGQMGRLLTLNDTGEQCLQYLKVRQLDVDTVEFIAASPFVCKRGSDFVTQPSPVVLGQTYRLVGKSGN
jgi:hypothetical protein